MTILYKMISKKLKMKNGKPYWFAHAVHPNTIHLGDLATEMQRNCTVKVSDIHGVLTELVETMNDELQNGNIVKLDGLGSFRLSFHASQVAKPGDFSAAKSIKGFHVVFRPIHKKNGKCIRPSCRVRVLLSCRSMWWRRRTKVATLLKTGVRPHNLDGETGSNGWAILAC